MQMQQSMSRKGNCWDNAPTERFFRSLKHEELNYNNFRTVISVAQTLLGSVTSNSRFSVFGEME
jgi:transposase InsO family protein